MKSSAPALAIRRKEFPILQCNVNGRPLVYLDNAATSQKPLSVIRALTDYYSCHHANVHRGVHTLSQAATDAFEATRKATRDFIHAARECEIIYTAGTTAGINLVAQCMSGFLQRGDEIVLSLLEHHSNIVPWQLLAARVGAVIHVIPINSKGELSLADYEAFLSARTKIVAINHVSNALGTINPVKEMIRSAHRVKAKVLIDGAQAVPHMVVDVQDLDADFYAFSAHKMYGPTGLGILYGKESWLNEMPPYQSGGEMIEQVRLEKTTFAPLPFKFEAGTPNIAAAIAFHAALDFMRDIGMETIREQEDKLLRYATERLAEMPGVQILGTAAKKAGVLSFNVVGAHPFDVGSILDKMGIAVRTGHHCAQPLMKHYEIPGTVRASFAFYNTSDEVDALVDGIKFAQKMLL
ncbi:MAG: cysteine desulfurase [Flavobacteriales bacterium]